MDAPPVPPAPTEEQMALSDATFKQVPLCIDPNTDILMSPTHDMTLLNALSRSLKALPPQIAFPPPPNVVLPQRSMAVNKAREDGNAAFKKKDMVEAIKMYTLAVDVAASRPLWESNQIAREELAAVLANRSAALAAVEDWIGALCDADAVINLKKPWAKGYFRKGKALAGLGRFKEAKEAYEMGMQFDPDNPDFAAALAELPKRETS
ncbi:TPR-like protein [Tilletiaria anomala UBC 951]|uniref:TPR-like protein n=1 Tax=Tilletiaria anomala (strain ATCC 24038 / CBS 436.72 / UBC 951) TaxID=1037660 RepID=A0A066WKY6_TILAU|nr:TPR-like protein [Tilletiaria anomala UBC 951]KDN53238.1 TPR-like protein [Tilletiaria anomala UBC 951]